MARILVCCVLALAVASSGPQAAGQQQDKDAYLQGKIVKVLPQVNKIMLRLADGNKTKTLEYNVDNKTKFWDEDGQPVKNGLRYAGFKEGADVWLRTAPGQSAQLVREMSLYNPTKEK